MTETASLNGWLVLDKPPGMSSAQAVGAVKRLLRPGKIGHAGTLDPFASGVLPLALGEATKTVSYMMGARKTYRFTAHWGEERTTDDPEGEVTESNSLRPRREDIEAALPAFTGTILQTPPIFSAIKVDGNRAYALARKGEEVELAPREVRVDTFTLLRLLSADEAEFEVTCGKGTYIRALARDLGRKLGCLAYVSQLRRTAVGKFDEKGAISLDKCKELGHIPALHTVVWPVESALDDILAMHVDSNLASQLQQGKAIITPLVRLQGGSEGQAAYAMSKGKVVALCEVKGGALKPVRVLNY